MIAEQNSLAQQKLELESELESRKDIEDHFRRFQKQIRKLAEMDIQDERVFKV